MTSAVHPPCGIMHEVSHGILTLYAYKFIRDLTGKFPEFPSVDDGGSLAIFKKREEPVSLKMNVTS